MLLGPVAAESPAPVDDQDDSPASVTLASGDTDTTAPVAAPLVVKRSVTATVGASHKGAPAVTTGPTVVGDVVLEAYRTAAAVAPASCNLEVSLLAAIGQVESGNLAGRRLDSDHRPVPPVLGPVLDGSGGFAAISDTDRGQWDGDTSWDRAVGPMQFIPSSWRLSGVDLDSDGERHPQDIEDAAGAAMVYLCAGGADLSTTDGLRRAIFSYNHSDEYVSLVLAWKQAFDDQGLELDLAEAPLLDLNAEQYNEVVRTVDASTARTADALGNKPPKTRPEVESVEDIPGADKKDDATPSKPGKHVAAAAAGTPTAGKPSSSSSSTPAAAGAAADKPAGASPAAEKPAASGSTSPSPTSESPASSPSDSPASSPSDSPASSPSDSPASSPADSPASSPASDPPASQDPTPADKPAADPEPEPPAAEEPAPAPDPSPTPTPDCPATPVAADPTPTEGTTPLDPAACPPPADGSPAPTEPPASAAADAATREARP